MRVWRVVGAALVLCAPLLNQGLLGEDVPGQDAPMFRNDLRHSGIYGGAGVPELHGVKWKFHTDGEVVSSPAVVSGAVYVAATTATYMRSMRRRGPCGGSSRLVRGSRRRRR